MAGQINSILPGISKFPGSTLYCVLTCTQLYIKLFHFLSLPNFFPLPKSSNSGLSRFKNMYICPVQPVGGGGSKALADMSAKNVFFLGGSLSNALITFSIFNYRREFTNHIFSILIIFRIVTPPPAAPPGDVT